MSINNPRKLFNVLFCITIKNSQHLYAVFLIFSLAISDDSQEKNDYHLIVSRCTKIYCSINIEPHFLSAIMSHLTSVTYFLLHH